MGSAGERRQLADVTVFGKLPKTTGQQPVLPKLARSNREG